ncbi:MAG TPA: HAD family hydrolase [Terriglobales bacterium]|nr:HAD family hydrolase [Terriglobales bacterium]
MKAVLFDLDDTLLQDQPWVEEAMLLACEPAGSVGVAPAMLSRAIREQARSLWGASSTYPYCSRVGISSWEGLVSDTPGPGTEAGALAAWLPEYRRLAWEGALASLDVDDTVMARSLSERYRRIRRSRYRLLDGAVPILDGLRGGPGPRLGLVTNGPSDLQHEKIDSTGIRDRFQIVLVSGDLGTGKPDPAIFDRAVATLGVWSGSAIMVGDSLDRDIAGARAAGLTTLWISHGARLPAGAIVPDLVVSDLPAAAEAIHGWLAA